MVEYQTDLRFLIVNDHILFYALLVLLHLVSQMKLMATTNMFNHVNNP